MILTLVSGYVYFILFFSTPFILAYSIKSDSFIYPTFFTSTPLFTPVFVFVIINIAVAR